MAFLLDAYTVQGEVMINSRSSPAFIGSSVGGDELFDGLIDELVFYDRALSASEIENIFFAGWASKCK